MSSAITSRKGVRRVRRVISRTFAFSFFTLAGAILSIAVGNAIDAGTAQLTAGVVSKDIIYHSTLTRRVAGSRATEFIIAVLTLHHEGTTTAVCYYRAYTSVPQMD